MATGGERSGGWKGDDFRHTCGLCMEPYRGRQPKILPCFHTFCLPCLATLAATAAATTSATENDNNADSEKKVEVSMEDTEEGKDTGGQATQGGGGGGDGGEGAGGVVAVVFLCPTCRSPVKVPEGGVASLQTNFYLDHDEEADTIPRPVPCDMCEEGQTQDATHACDKCRKRMCRACRRLHDMVTDPEIHRVRPLGPQDQPAAAQMSKVEVKKCPFHPDQPLVFHCCNCDVSICLHCKLTSHEGHKTDDMATAARRAREEMTGLLAKANEQIQTAATLLDRVDHEEKEIVRQKQEVTREVGIRCDTIIQWASRARDEIMDSVTSQERKTLRDLQAERTIASTTVDTLSALVSHAASTQGQDVVSLKALQSALLSEDALDKLNKRAGADSQAEFFPCQSDTSAVELEMIQAYVGRPYASDGPGPAVENSAASVRALSLRVDELNNKLADLTTQVASDKDEVTKLGADFTRKLKDLTSKVASDEDDIKSKVTKLGDDFTQKLKDLTTKVASETAQVTKVTADLKTIRDKAWMVVSFQARMFRKKSNNGILIFDVTVFNTGFGYDATTGVFTAPIDGLYAFFVTVGSASENAAVSASLKNEHGEYGKARGTYTGTGSAHVALKLSSGAKTWVTHDNDVSRFHSKECFFTGALVQAQL